MALNSSTIGFAVNISAAKTTASGSVLTAATQFQDVPTFSNGTATALTATHCIDQPLTANATATTLANMTTTLADTVTPSALKFLRISNDAANANATVTASFLGLSAFPIQPGGIFVWVTPTANGVACNGTQTIQANGTANQTLRVTMLVN